MQVLLVEDEPRMAELVERTLSEDGHQVVVARDGREGFEIARCSTFDVIVLDVMLPGIDGVEVARRLRARADPTPVLMLTARDAAADIVSGLDAGADDYLAKPFSFKVLLARVRALGRRGSAAEAVSLRVADLALDTSARLVTRAGARLSLTRTEFNLLECLMRQAGRVVTRQMIVERLWGGERDVGSNTLDAFVKLLRHKLDAGGRPRLIQTIRGVGYCLREEPEP
jgi:two-component system response regulator MprA